MSWEVVKNKRLIYLSVREKDVNELLLTNVSKLRTCLLTKCTYQLNIHFMVNGEILQKAEKGRRKRIDDSEISPVNILTGN